MPFGRTYRPRMSAVLTVPVSGSASNRESDDKTDDCVSFAVRVRKAVLEQNDHNHADTLKITAEWADTGVDPRLLSSATIQFYLGDSDATQGRTNSSLFVGTPDNLRFVGIAVNVGRVAKSGEGLCVDMEFHDYTSIFLQTKPFVSRGVPDLSQTLDDAWRRICDNTGVSLGDGTIQSSVAALKDRLVLVGLDSFPALSRACAPRFAKLAKVSVQQGADAWAVWKACCGMVGLITFVLKDQVIVTTAEGYYNGTTDASGNPAAPPRLVWGKNIESWSETRKSALFAKGVGITSFDPITGTTLEALWPPPGDPAILHKRLTAKKAADPEAVRKACDYQYFAVPEITNPAALLDCAKRVYEERSRQELEGTLRTVEMAVDDTNGQAFELLNLHSGDVIRIEFGDELRDRDGKRVDTGSGVAARTQALIRLGYSEGAAQLIAANLDDIARLDCLFYVKKVTTTLEFTDDGGSYETEIQYANRIKVSGDASAK